MDNAINTLPVTDRLPAMFVGHGSPMSALEDNAFTRTWEEMGNAVRNISAILCISAHWETQGSFITAMDHPRTIHDFYGFPQALYDVQYPAPGAADIAQAVQAHVARGDGDFLIGADQSWGLDHGSWSVLIKMFPDANIPTLQLSIDTTKPPDYHYQLGQRLAPLRERGVLIIGSGNIVHNLQRLNSSETGYDWAVEFDCIIAERLAVGDHQALINYQQFGEAAELSVPTDEHFIPLLYVAGTQHKNDTLKFKNDSVTMGSISMRSVLYVN